ncbi:mandelate racemase [Paenibacillus cisolokensis]|uniref:Mandelate racemase n=1 Tax=Paenibacillus cisolokensis TaxID=1658519 RepID=A0ABQ4NDQ4_9BACL|nr:enolase C-terminal domain-like protein [Paenibacillus cisolokensis]GIQ66321.1 mandelate racemase [Paenibacillus cisolokensis]
MRITDVELFPLKLPMKQHFTISNGRVGDASGGAPHVYVRITADNGAFGWGEARPSHRWSYETLETVSSTIKDYLRPLLLGMEATDLRSIHAAMNREIRAGLGSGQPIAKAAIDTALHDLIGNAFGMPLAQMWHGSPAAGIKLSYLISTASPEEAAAKAAYARENGYEGVDVKIGLDPQQDIAILEAVKAAAPDLFFRVDANQAYNLPQAVALAKQMERIGVDVFEQPLPANNLHGHAELRKKTTIPIALDESIWTPGDVMQAIRLEACDTIVVKLTKMGGLSGAKLCGEIAREAGFELLGGGLTESTLGLTASAHLFRYLGIKRPVDLNGPIFLADDPVEAGPVITEGDVELPQGAGIGCTISMDKIEKFRV